ncbi:MAG: hypothetical protein H7Y38_01780 [Armatimonadetes bacterium]|nr:hypothetical protein [Armatimonadota bacterium]
MPQPNPLLVPLVSNAHADKPVAVAALPAKRRPFSCEILGGDAELAARLRLYDLQNGAWTLLGDGTAARTSASGKAGIAIVPPDPGAKNVPNRFVVRMSKPYGETVNCRVAPVLLTSSLDPVETVFVVQSKLTGAFVAELTRLLPKCDGKPRLQVIDGSAVPHDIWMQDTVEIGVCAVPDGRGVKQIPVPLTGLRALHNGIKTAPFDDAVRQHFAAAARYVPVQAAASRPNTRWIDWFGNMEVSPPVPGFPHGRVLTGYQKDLRFHPDFLAFLEAQGLQVPPLFIDVSWLTIGHVDEIINFVPARGGKGFRALLPSPALAKSLLETAAKNGHGNAPVFAGTKEATTVTRLLSEVAESGETRVIEKSLSETRRQLRAELALGDADIVTLPVLFKDGLPVIPNAVNSLVIGRDAIAPAPLGAKVGGTDIFEKAIRDALVPLGCRVHFVDIWEPYHTRSGEIHCGTNTVRRLQNPRWWANEKR